MNNQTQIKAEAHTVNAAHVESAVRVKRAAPEPDTCSAIMQELRVRLCNVIFATLSTFRSISAEDMCSHIAALNETGSTPTDEELRCALRALNTMSAFKPKDVRPDTVYAEIGLRVSSLSDDVLLDDFSWHRAGASLVEIVGSVAPCKEHYRDQRAARAITALRHAKRVATSLGPASHTG